MILSKENTFIISLPERKYDRLDLLTSQMDNYNLGYTVFPAIRNQDGRLGLLLTIREVFMCCLRHNIEYAWVLEDDSEFIERPQIIEKAVSQVPSDFDLLYFGSYIIRRPERLFATHLFRVEGVYSTHSVVYGKAAMEEIIATINQMIPKIAIRPFDQLLVNKIQKRGKSYHSYPAVFKQRSGYSDIEKQAVDYYKYHETGFRAMTDHLSAENRL